MERESLAAFWGIHKFRFFIEDSHVRIMTDQNSLHRINRLRNTTGRLARWALEFQQYKYTMRYRKGSQNIVPDLLSRLYQDEHSEATEIAAAAMAKQTNEQWHKKLFKEVRENPADHPWYKIVGDRLYTYCSDTSIENFLEDQDGWKLVLSKKQRPILLYECHEEPSAGHFGRRKAYERVATYYYWPKLNRDVANFVRKFEVCQQCKVLQLLPAALMGKRVIRRP